MLSATEEQVGRVRDLVSLVLRDFYDYLRASGEPLVLNGAMEPVEDFLERFGHIDENMVGLLRVGLRD